MTSSNRLEATRTRPPRRAGLAYRRWLQDRNDVDGALRDLFAAQVLEYDRDGNLAGLLASPSPVSITSRPSGAAIRLFVHRSLAELEDGGEPRWVAVPFTDPRLRDAASLRGASPCGTTPFATELPAGADLAILEGEGRRTVRLPFHVDHRADPYHRHGHATFDVVLPPAHDAEAGWIHIPAGAYGNEEERDVEIMEREVTVAEWRSFLAAQNNPRHLAPILGGRAWSESTAGAFDPPGDVWAEQPITGVTRAAALAYAAWRTRSDESGRIHRLPRRIEWIRASAGGDGRRDVFGNAFRAHWIASKFAPGARTAAATATALSGTSIFTAVVALSGGQVVATTNPREIAFP